MEGTAIAFTLCGGIIILVMGLGFFGVWNQLDRLEKDVDRPWSTTDEDLQQSFDMEPHMEKIVIRYGGNEQELFR